MEAVDLKTVVERMHALGLRQWLLEELTESFEVARKGKRHTYDEHSFDVNWGYNIITLCDSILERRYEVSPSIVFVIFDPMVREIFAATFRDRIVHHFLYRMQGGWWDRHFINDSYSCRVGKGTLYAQKRVQQMMRKVSVNCTGPAWVMKMDIKGYFMSLPRLKLCEKVRWGIERQFACVEKDPMGRQLKQICEYLWEKVLMDDPTVNARRRGEWWHWNDDVLPASKSLFAQPPGYGLPIGNVTSQLASNIYMDEFDRFVRYDLGYKYYGRYVDDFVIVDTDKKRMIADVPKMEEFLRTRLQLTLHPKKRYIQDVRKGVNFVGAEIYPKHIHPGRRLMSKFPAALEKLLAGEGDIDTVESYVGLMRHVDAERYIAKVIDRLNVGE